MYKIAILFLAFLLVISCSQDSRLTYPAKQTIILGKEPAIVRLGYKENILVNNELLITFNGVGADSRCPIDAMCVWAGDGEVRLTAAIGNSVKDFVVHSFLTPHEFVFDKYVVELIKLFPLPKTNHQIKQEEYYIEINIKPLSANMPGQVQLINANNSEVIKKDMLNVNEISLEKDLLTFSVGHSGGCREHFIELFAFKEIAKSDPAQVTVTLSHNSNGDMCEAYVTRKIQFDLLPLKQFLKNNYGNISRVLLVIFDPSGRSLKNPTIEYNI